MAETNKHYDLSPEFFAQFLDPYMKYTSGLFHGDESPEAGAQNMLDRHISFLKFYNQPRILEVGPGWGSLISRLQETASDYQLLDSSNIEGDL